MYRVTMPACPARGLRFNSAEYEYYARTHDAHHMRGSVSFIAYCCCMHWAIVRYIVHEHAWDFLTKNKQDPEHSSSSYIRTYTAVYLPDTTAVPQQYYRKVPGTWYQVFKIFLFSSSTLCHRCASAATEIRTPAQPPVG